MAKQLDVRSLITTQNLVLTLVQLLIKPSSKRHLMRMQRKHKVLEPYASNSSSDDDSLETNLAVSKKAEVKNYKKFLD